MSRLRNPWGRPRFLALLTAGYILWSVVPVLLAIAFAFNNGRSRTTWQGFSFRWFTGETGSVMHDPALRDALGHTLLLAVICVAVATPLGVAKNTTSQPRSACALGSLKASSTRRRRLGNIADTAVPASLREVIAFSSTCGCWASSLSSSTPV